MTAISGVISDCFQAQESPRRLLHVRSAKLPPCTVTVPGLAFKFVSPGWPVNTAWTAKLRNSYKRCPQST